MPELAEQSGAASARPKFVSSFKLQSHTAVIQLEFFLRQLPAPCGGIVEVDLSALKSVQHDKVAVLPKQDQRRFDSIDLVGAQSLAFAYKPVMPGCAEQASGAAAVAAHFADFPQFCKRHPAAEMTQDHAQAGGAALGCVHLQHRRGDRPPFELLRSAAHQPPREKTLSW